MTEFSVPAHGRTLSHAPDNGHPRTIVVRAPEECDCDRGGDRVR
ncbi:hypothetical protein FTUN_0063 [Frigoriglobus tundricola]|uniref:Uncharacterized protein n=1 Tax=Frigoriglobus tundricola TaxID=2774151 RepID=A0A6M5YEY2_9BACT|nr:hypothetical protein FTUN_0063 [Frigoriglobus tundricola]